jgi:hypothetical protein
MGQEPIEIGLPDITCMTVAGIVFGPDNVPAVTDRTEAAKDVCFTVFSALTHSRSRKVGGILNVLAEALGTVDAKTGALLAEFTEAGLGSTAGLEIWRQLMATNSYPYVSQTRAEGRAEGRIEERRMNILRILESRGVAASDEVRDLINGCDEAEVLDRWFDMALVAKDASELLLPAQRSGIAGT